MDLRPFAWACVVALPGLPSVALAQKPEPADLTAHPRLAEDATEPRFADYTAQRLKDEVRVVASRSFAVFGFNTPEVQVYLPHCDNSIYAKVEFEKPRLLSANRSRVAYELEHGIFDHDTFSNEIRFLAEDGRTPAKFARAQGAATVKFPLRVVTVRQRAGQPSGDSDIAINGPFVDLRESDRVPEAEAFSSFTALRAYDSSGHQLARHSWTGFTSKNGVTTRHYAFWGKVVEVRLDRVESWAKLSLTYDLSAVAPLPPERAGMAPPEGQPIVDTPGGHVVKILAAEDAPGARPDAPATPSISPEQARQRLKALHFGRVNAQFFCMAAGQGKLEAVKMFLAAGLDVDSRDPNQGVTPLISAAMLDREEVVAFLVKAGADVNAVDSNGSSALTWLASHCKATPVLQQLIAAGANIHVKAKGGATPLMMAKVSRCTENIKLLR